MKLNVTVFVGASCIASFILFAMLFQSATVQVDAAGPFVVDTNTDESDNDAGDGTCATANGNCTFRAAIEEANASGTTSTIKFNVPLASSTITLGNTEFPNLAVSVDVNGENSGNQIAIVSNSSSTDLFGSSFGQSLSGVVIENITFSGYKTFLEFKGPVTDSIFRNITTDNGAFVFSGTVENTRIVSNTINNIDGNPVFGIQIIPFFPANSIIVSNTIAYNSIDGVGLTPGFGIAMQCLVTENCLIADNILKFNTINNVLSVGISLAGSESTGYPFIIRDNILQNNIITTSTFGIAFGYGGADNTANSSTIQSQIINNTVVSNTFSNINLVPVFFGTTIGTDATSTRDISYGNLMRGNTFSNLGGSPFFPGINEGVGYDLTNSTLPQSLNVGADTNDGISTTMWPNRGIDYPIITRVTTTTDDICIAGIIGRIDGVASTTVNSDFANKDLEVDIYTQVTPAADTQQAAIDSSTTTIVSHGEPNEFIGTISVTTNYDGTFGFSTSTCITAPSYVNNNIIGVTVDPATNDTSEIGVTLASFELQVDSDGDTILDAADNCVNTSNPSQSDTDGDDIGDACDPTDDTEESGSGGGGGGGATFVAPTRPNVGGISGGSETTEPQTSSAFQINNGAQSTNNTNVTINFKDISDVSQVALSENKDFSGVSYTPYSSTMDFTLSSGNGEKTVYAKLRSSQGGTVILKDSITLTNQSTQQPDVVKPVTPSNCPVSTQTAIKSPNDTAVYYVTKQCTKRPFKKSTVYFTYFTSWNDTTVLPASTVNSIPTDTLGFMPYGPKYNPTSGAVVKTVDSPKVYLFINQKLYHIESPDAAVFQLGPNWERWMEAVDQRLIDAYQQSAQPLNSTTRPNGMIVKYTNSPKVYQLTQNPTDPTTQMKRWITDEQTFKALNFRDDHIITIPADEVYADGENL